MTGIEIGTAELINVFRNSNIFGVSWIIPIVLVLLTCVAITRDYNKWKTLVLPVATLWSAIGLNINYIILTGGAIMFVGSNLSVEVFGGILESVKKVVGIQGTIREDKIGQLERMRTERKRIFRLGKENVNKLGYTTEYEEGKRIIREEATTKAKPRLIALEKSFKNREKENKFNLTKMIIQNKLINNIKLSKEDKEFMKKYKGEK